MKRCARCHLTKRLADFHVNVARRDGVQTYCKFCRAVIDHERYERRRGTELPTRRMTGEREAVLEELAKCELVCTNCHTIRTFERAGWPRARNRMSEWMTLYAA